MHAVRVHAHARAHTHTHTHTQNSTSWSLPSSLRQPPAAPTATLHRQPTTGCVNPAIQRSPWLVYLTVVDAQWRSGPPAPSTTNTALNPLTGSLVTLYWWVAQSVLFFHPKSASAQRAMDRPAGRLLPLNVLQPLWKIRNSHTHTHTHTHTSSISYSSTN